MPELSRFMGIIVAMYYRDHGPPHFHALYGEHEATIVIETGVVAGHLPRRSLKQVQAWRSLHMQELLTAWALAERREPLPNIKPLE